MKGLKGFLARFGIMNLVVVGVFLSGNALYDRHFPEKDWSQVDFTAPVERPVYDTSKYNVVFDQHSHSFHSDGVLSEEQVIEWELQMGFNAFVLTDHNSFAGVDKVRRVAEEKYGGKVTVLAGVEWTTNRTHLNFIFPPDTESDALQKAFPKPPVNPTDAEIAAAIAKAHELGGLVTANHLPWTSRTYQDTRQPSRGEYLAMGVDNIEIVNEYEWDEESYGFCKARGLGMVTGTDMHQPSRVTGWTLLAVPEPGAETVFAALKARKGVPLYNAAGIAWRGAGSVRDNPMHKAFGPLVALGAYFTEMTWPAVKLDECLITLAWIWAVFVALEALRAAGLAVLARSRRRA